MPRNVTALVRHVADPLVRVPDGEYLRRFVEDRDEEAFAELVRRNGPGVLRACRSVLHNPADADDAFQAVFLQLARHATSLTASVSTAGWLHKVAVRAAGAIRRAEARRHRHEQQVRPVPTDQPAPDLTWLELREAIDTELARMPEKYRLPLLFCYIEGLTYGDAAARLGCSLGALHGRLERGRRWLQRRLGARGLPAVALTLGAGTCPTVSAALHDRAVTAVRALIARPVGLVGWSLPTPRSALWAGCVVVLVIGVGLGAFPNSAAPPADTPRAGTSTPADSKEKAPDPARDVFGDPLPKGATARLGTDRFLAYSRDLALAPDGKTLAIGEQYGRSLTLIDAVTGQVLRHQASVGVGGDYTFPGKEGGFTTPGIFWRPDGRGVALVGLSPWDKYLWDFTDPNDVPPAFEQKPNEFTPPKLTPPEGAVACAAVSEDGKWIAVARQPSDPARRVVQVFPCETGKYLRTLKPDRTFGPFPAACERIWFAAGGRELILARADRTVVAIDATTGKELRHATLPKWAVIAPSPDGKLVAIIPRHPERDVWHTGEECVRVWDLARDKEVYALPRPGDSISGLAFTPDGKHLVTADDEFDFRKWDLSTGKEAALRQPHSGYGCMSAVAVSADGKRYATARPSGPIKVWDAGTGAHLNPLATHRDSVAGVAVSPDSRLVATVGYDGALRVWEASGRPVCTVAAPRVNPTSRYYGACRAVAFTPDGCGVVFDAAGVLAMVEPTTGKSLALPGGLKGLTGTLGGFSPDGKTLVTFSGDTATLWNWPSGAARKKFTVALGKRQLWGEKPKTPSVPVIASATLSPDGGTLITISNQRSALENEIDDGPNSNDCWDVTGKRRFQFAPELWYPRIAFSPDGRTFYAGGHPSDPEALHGRVRRDGLVALNVSTGSILRKFDDPLAQPNDPRDARHVGALALSPDGRLLAVAERPWSAIVWVYETASGRLVRRFEGHDAFINALAFSPDGSKLVSVSHDHTGLVWDVTPPVFTDRAPGPLSPKELTDSWGRLAAPDPVLAWQAVADLAGSPAEAVAFLADKLGPTPVPTDADLDRIEKQLAAPGFEDREKASAALDAFGPNAAAAVKARLRATDSPEVARRFDEFLARHAGERASPVVLRGVRGVAVLEAIGTPEARKVLTKLAGSRPADPLSAEAAAALARLGR
jgi:RNA polymerase sigma factor (sigma-70 family)